MSYATAALATFTNMLGTLDHLASKAMAAGVSDDLLQARLAEDMFPLEQQFRVAMAQVIVALDRLGNLGIESLDESAISSFAEARARIAAVRDMVANTDPATWPASGETVEFTLPNGMAFAMQAHEYVRDWTLPNLYFHTSMAYGLLRAGGLSIGKADFIGYMMRYMKQPTPAA